MRLKVWISIQLNLSHQRVTRLSLQPGSIVHHGSNRSPRLRVKSPEMNRLPLQFRPTRRRLNRIPHLPLPAHPQPKKPSKSPPRQIGRALKSACSEVKKSSSPPAVRSISGMISEPG